MFFNLVKVWFHVFLLSLAISRDANKPLTAVFSILCNENIDNHYESFSNSSALASNPL
jgi:hypothetical protein